MLKINSVNITKESGGDWYVYKVIDSSNGEEVAKFEIVIDVSYGEQILTVNEYSIKDPRQGFISGSSKMISTTILGAILRDVYEEASRGYNYDRRSFDVSNIDDKDEYLWDEFGLEFLGGVYTLHTNKIESAVAYHITKI